MSESCHYNYLSHEYQNMIADVVNQRFLRNALNAKNYTAAKLQEAGKKYGENTQLSELEDSETYGSITRENLLNDLLKKMGKNTAVQEAKKFLLYCVQKELEKITTAFKNDQNRGNNKTALFEYLVSVSKLMSRAQRLDQQIEDRCEHRYYWGSNIANKWFKDVILFCDDKLKLLDQMIDLRIYQVLAKPLASPVENIGSAERVGFFKELPFSRPSQPVIKEPKDIAKTLLKRKGTSTIDSDEQSLLEKLLTTLRKNKRIFYYQKNIGPRHIIDSSIPQIVYDSDTPSPSSACLRVDYTSHDNHPSIEISSEDSSPKSFFVLDKYSPLEVNQRGIKGTKRLYETAGEAYYDLLKHQANHLDPLLHKLRSDKMVSEQSSGFVYTFLKGWTAKETASPDITPSPFSRKK